jgi:hypothetical protein
LERDRKQKGWKILCRKMILGRDRKQRAGIILAGKKIMGRNRKQRAWNNSFEARDIERQRNRG